MATKKKHKKVFIEIDSEKFWFSYADWKAFQDYKKGIRPPRTKEEIYDNSKVNPT